MSQIHTEVQEYYGKTLQNTDDLKTAACCTITPPPQYIADIMAIIADEVHAKYYGCGLTIPSAIDGLRVLDLGSGSGRDCYIAAKLVGEKGSVLGVDMTDEQLAVANNYTDFHKEKFGYQKSNVSFVKGNIDSLEELNLEPGSFDLIISNCVINLSVNKQKLLNDIYALLKPGGEMYFSDVYSDRRVPLELQRNKILWGECLSGALYWNDFLTMSKEAGFADPRAVENKPVAVEDQALIELVGDIQFFSVTYRLMKLDGLESNCEDYGQAVKYIGGIKERPSGFTLDDHHYFPLGKLITVCGNTFKMLNETRFKKYFEFYGNWDVHYGIFEGCGGEMPFSYEDSDQAACC